MDRIASLKQAAFNEGRFDGFLIFNHANLIYFTGFTGASALLISKEGAPTLYVYNVNYEQAKAEGKAFKVELVKRSGDLLEDIAKQVKELKIRNLALDASSIESWRVLTRKVRDLTKLKIQGNIVCTLRKVKDEQEIELIRKAADLTSEGMRVAYETVALGMREYEVAAEIEYAMRKKGSYGTAFETIVASGRCSAFPHGGCSDREIRKGDLVVVDVGATYRYYHSDMTRTFVAGKPSEKQQKIYDTVRAAQEKALDAVKPNIKAKTVDAAARKIIAEAGYGEHFVHNLGHGVGLEVHEMPILGPYSKEVLTAGNIFTVEPGIYLVGYGGIRIEDTVLLKKNGAQKLTKGTYLLSNA